MALPVILTRPAHRNAALAQRLASDGCKVLSLPALKLVPTALDISQLPLPGAFDILVFVSSYAVEQYLGLLQDRLGTLVWPHRTIAATVGQASAQPLYRSGSIPSDLIVHPTDTSTGSDSEALWALLVQRDASMRKVLVLRGQAGREWLGRQFEQAGASVQRLSLYQRQPEIWTNDDAREITGVLKGPNPPVFLLTSSESVDALYANIQRYQLTSEWLRSTFVVIHDRISSHLQSILQSSSLCTSPTIVQCAPTDESIYQTIKSVSLRT